MMKEQDKLSYSLAAAAEATGLSKRALEAHAAAGRLKTKKIGGRRIILRRDLLAFIGRDQPFAVPAKASA